VAGHALADRAGLAHVEDLLALVAKQIDARRVGQPAALLGKALL
jgi:hypothetical protein